MKQSSFHIIVFVLILTVLLYSAFAAAQDSRGVQREAAQSNPVNIEPRDRAMANLWRLSMQEWQRYEKLRRGLGQYRSNKLDPITVLGINARSAAERRKYAERLARMEHERIKRVLAFQRAYTAAFERLYPEQPRVATNSMTRALTQGRQAARRLGLVEQRKAVFVRTQDCAACRATVKRLAAAGTPMDIFIIDADSDGAIRSWARSTGIDPARVRSGAITLNHAPASAAEALAGQALPRVITR